MIPIDLSAKDLQIVTKILAEYLPGYEICAFGSRVQWTAHKSSDLDLVVMTEKPLPILKMIDLKEAFSESDLPFRVDAVDWAVTNERFKKLIVKQMIVIKEKM